MERVVNQQIRHLIKITFVPGNESRIERQGRCGDNCIGKRYIYHCTKFDRFFCKSIGKWQTPGTVEKTPCFGKSF